MLWGWEGNRRSGIALAMRHRLSGITTYRLNGLRKGDDHPAYAPVEYGTFTFTPTKLTGFAQIPGYNRSELGVWTPCPAALTL